MTDDELKSIVKSYIAEIVEGDAADCLHEMEELGDADDETMERAYGLWGRAKVSVVWDDDPSED